MGFPGNLVSGVSKLAGKAVDAVEDVGEAVAEVVEDVVDLHVDAAKGVWDVHETIIDFAADAAETVSPVLGIAGTAVGMPWLGGLDEALGAVSDIMDGEMPDLADVFTGATSFIPGLDGLNPSSLLGAGLGELGLDDLGDLGVSALSDALGIDLGSASSLLGGDFGDIVEKLGEIDRRTQAGQAACYNNVLLAFVSCVHRTKHNLRYGSGLGLDRPHLFGTKDICQFSEVRASAALEA